jgi:hypothetical protein
MLWTTALTARYAYFTVLRLRSDGTSQPVILRVRR